MRYIYFALLLFFYSLPGLAAGTAELLGLRTQTSPQQTRFVFIFSEIPRYHIDVLSKPNRLLLDFKATNVSIDLDALRLDGSLISSLRHIQR